VAETAFYVLFRNHNDGLELHSYLREHGYAVRISPAPRVTQVCCGMSLLVDPAHIEQVRIAIERSGIPVERIVELGNQIDPRRDRYYL
jgi:hypothetical protein